MPAKASMSAGLRFSSRAVSAAGRPLSAISAFIFAVGAASTIADDAISAAPASNRFVYFIFPLPFFVGVSLAHIRWAEEGPKNQNQAPRALPFKQAPPGGITAPAWRHGLPASSSR